MKSADINKTFRKSIEDYHLNDEVDMKMPTQNFTNKFEELLYLKNWIDTVQWHLEDIIRDPNNKPETLVAIKRRIDASNQHRTDVVEEIDEYIAESIKNVTQAETARLNSETPAWLLDRMSILQLKIYHFQEQIERKDIDENHLNSVQHKLAVLKVQEADLAKCFDELMEDLTLGKKYMRLYKQMKMYNDPALNPVLYGKG